MASAQTQTAILDTAEQLFAEYGFSGVSLRRIIAAAGVNLASVHYHFGSKEVLIQAILARRIGPLNEERLAQLSQAEKRAGKAGPSLSRILEALIGPALRLSRDPARGGDMFVRLIGRILSDPNPRLQEMLIEQIRGVADRFLAAFRKALPGLPLPDLYWRLHFIIGGMAHTMTHGRYLQVLSGGCCDPGQVEPAIEVLVAFAAAGLKAPKRRIRK